MPFRWLLSLTLLLCLLNGCGTYNMEEVRLAFEDGNFEGALAYLDENPPKKSKLPYLFERGLVAQYANRFEESNRAFENAEITAEDLYTKSISREVVSLLTSDTVRSYPGTRYERLLVHYYRAFNYIYLNLPDEALVECRRAGRLLQYYADEDATYNFAGAAFIAYLSGILYEWTGDWNDAYIAYRQAEAGYQRYTEQFGIPLPEDIGYALVRLARLLDFEEEALRYAQLYGEPRPRPPRSGELILIYESGFVPQKVEKNVFLPILKTDRFEDDDEEEEKKKMRRFADQVVKRRHHHYKEIEVEYLLRVAIPAYTSNRPQLAGVEARVEDIQVPGVLVEDIEEIAIATFASEQGTILLRTVVRGLVKYLAFRRANKEGELAGRLVNLFNVATERADTRSWETLPNQIFLVRMRLPAGTHDVTLSFLNGENQPVRTETLHDVSIRANGMTFLNYRTFE
ncbi:MAG: hypothetical protein O7E52_11335 [Candidatus Poribacteria bacterium]|nr:hypothetical protein [Candidatus Poribacteria bacterium]